MGAKACSRTGAWEYGRDMLREHIQHTNINVHTLSFCVGEYFPTFVGQFASYHDHILLHHQCTKGILSIYKGEPHLSLAFSLCVFLCGSHRWVHNHSGDWESAVQLVLQCELWVLRQASGTEVSYWIHGLGCVGDV